MIKILGIETSCDETSAAIVTDSKKILANVVLSQVHAHAAYGGVVPEIAARAHMEHLQNVIKEALHNASCRLCDIDAIAVTSGPGLIGGLIVGVMTAKAIASVHKKPLIAVNHLEGHALTVRLVSDIEFPFLLLLISGGHCQFLIAEGVGKYQLLGETLDDALGEAFDKVAKMLGLPQPGGPQIEAMAKKGNHLAYNFPIPLKGRAGCDFSFSGLKTAVLLSVKNSTQITSQTTPQIAPQITPQIMADICASFQHTACEALLDRARNAIGIFKEKYPDGKNFVLAGGVAANQKIRENITSLLAEYEMQLIAPPPALCTDNAAMIAWAGVERYKLGISDSLSIEPQARWPLSKP